ncbi:MAG: hypothetical protein ACJA01_001723 [Saprospiraceae bacterium]|jgi:hypothetical protein
MEAPLLDWTIFKRRILISAPIEKIQGSWAYPALMACGFYKESMDLIMNKLLSLRLNRIRKEAPINGYGMENQIILRRERCSQRSK